MTSYVQGTLAFADPQQERPRWAALASRMAGKHGWAKFANLSEVGARNGFAPSQPPAEATRVQTPDIEVLPEYDQVRRAVHQRVPAIFVTGKAGTGKSTLIRYLLASIKGCAVVAPTAIAALNVGGDTIHSFFGIPPATVDPNEPIELRPKTRSLLRGIYCLIVDEVSMVTPNLVDRMDRLLREARACNQPFGGLTVIFVGDLLQLPPVVASEEELEFFNHLYGGVYFFLAKVFEQVEILPVALTTVRRQADQEFVEALSRIRSADDHREMVALINRKCYLEPQQLGRPHRGIHLVTTNAQAAQINSRELKALKKPSRTYEATITGDMALKAGREPAAASLELKVGAKVLFVANNKPAWVNGDRGEVVELFNRMVRVRKLGDGSVQDVEPFVWERHRYIYNAQERRLERRLVATYEQLPLALGWAITIHKSQGMSLDEVTLDLGNGSFAQGQTYVALSRCRSIEGLSLVRPIGMRDVRVDPRLIAFYKDLGLE